MMMCAYSPSTWKIKFKSSLGNIKNEINIKPHTNKTETYIVTGIFLFVLEDKGLGWENYFDFFFYVF